MNHETKCKFCQKSITLTIDDGYAELGDALKLYPYAACNTCADLKVERRRLTDAISRLCYHTQQRVKGFDHIATLAALVQLTKKYDTNVRKWLRCNLTLWDQAFPELLMERPDRWGDILNKFQSDFRKEEKNARMQEQPSLPHPND